MYDRPGSPVGILRRGVPRYGAGAAVHRDGVHSQEVRFLPPLPTMPTYRITDRATGQVLAPSVQADSEFSARAGFPEEADLVVTLISPNPPAAIYTIAWPQETARGIELVEVCTTGSRATALVEMGRQPPGRTLIEETPAANQAAARARRS